MTHTPLTFPTGEHREVHMLSHLPLEFFAPLNRAIGTLNEVMDRRFYIHLVHHEDRPKSGRINGQIFHPVIQVKIPTLELWKEATIRYKRSNEGPDALWWGMPDLGNFRRIYLSPNVWWVPTPLSFWRRLTGFWGDRDKGVPIDATFVIMHELLHCLGLRHNLDDAKDIMYPYSDGRVWKGKFPEVTRRRLLSIYPLEKWTV